MHRAQTTRELPGNSVAGSLVSTRAGNPPRGLKLIRIAVFVTLAQLAIATVMTVKALGADSLHDMRTVVEWTQYMLFANLAATVAMLLGVLRAIPELARARVDIGGLVIAASGFAITAAALGWNYHLISSFVAVAFDPHSSVDAVLASAESLDPPVA